LTIPIAPPNIGTTGVVEQPGAGQGLQLIALALQKRRELEQERQELAQRREQFELHKKIAGKQLAGMEIDQEQKLREMKAREDDLADRDEALRIWTGGLTQHNDPAAWGRIIAGVKDDGVATHLMSRLSEMATLQNTQASAQGTDLRNQQTVMGMEEDRQIHGIIQKLSNRPWDRRTISEAVGRVVAINPQKAGQVATALGSLLPDVAPHINDDGTVSWVPKAPGAVEGAPVQPARATDEQNKLATYGVRVLENNARMTELEQQFPGIGQRVDEKMSNVRSLEQYPGVGRTLATKALRVAVRGMSPEEREYWNLRTDTGNAFLRRATGAAMNMEELDRETSPYVPISGEDEGGVQAKQARRLQQGLLFVQQSGNAFRPNALSPKARQSLLQNIAPHPGYSPDNPFHPQPGTTTVPRP